MMMTDDCPFEMHRKKTLHARHAHGAGVGGWGGGDIKKLKLKLKKQKQNLTYNHGTLQ